MVDKAGNSLTSHVTPRSPWSGMLVHVVFPIAVGTVIYLLFRATTLLVFDWLETLQLLEVILALRQLVSGIHLPDWILYSLPDGLWVYAITSWMILIWDRRPPLLWLVVGFALGMGGEFGQAVGIVPGTYQHLDVLSYVAGFLMACLQLERTHETSLLIDVGSTDNDRVGLWKR